MAQPFLKYNEGQYKYFPDAATGLRCRSGQRDKRFVEDAEIVQGGFLLAENVGWVNIGGNALQITGNQIWKGGENIGGLNYYIIKGELTPTGFAGTESTDNGVTGDWVTIDAIPLTPLS